METARQLIFDTSVFFTAIQGDLFSGSENPGDVSVPAALRDEQPARPERREEPFEEPVVVEDPVERRRREDRVDALAELEVEQVGLPHVGTVAEEGSSLLDHSGVRVDCDHPAPRQALHEVGGDAPRAAAGVEHRLVAGELEAVEHGEAHRLHRAGDAVVALGIPVEAHGMG